MIKKFLVKIYDIRYSKPMSYILGKAKWFAIIALLSLAILAGRLNTHLNKSEATVSELGTKNTTLTTELDACSVEKERFATELTSKYGEIATIKTELDTSKARVAELEAQVAELNNQVSTKDAELSRLKVYSYSK